MSARVFNKSLLQVLIEEQSLIKMLVISEYAVKNKAIIKSKKVLYQTYWKKSGTPGPRKESFIG